MKLHFLGGAGTVTGSKYLLETDTTRVLVDCGLFQGLKVLRLRNRQPLPIDPSSIDDAGSPLPSAPNNRSINTSYDHGNVA